MATRTSVFAAFLLGLVPAAWGAGGDMPDEYAWLGVHLSQYWPYHEEIGPNFIEEATLPGARLGYRLPRGFSLQAQWERNEVRRPDSARELQVNNSFVSLRHHLDGGFIEPYLGVNIGELVFTTNEPSDETMLGLEAGVQRRIKPHWILDVGARVPKSVDKERFDFQVWIGLNHAFEINRTQETTRPEVEDKDTSMPDSEQESLRDSDRDGVPDERDECPGTGAGRAVDERGCKSSS